MTEPVSLDTWNIQPLCLPTSCDDACQEGEMGTIAGYGLKIPPHFTSRDPITASTEMTKATVPVASREVCINNYAPIVAISLQATIGPDSLCVGYPDAGGVSSCNNDGSTPLMCYKHGYFTVDGLTKASYGCAEKNFVGIYAGLCTVLGWINSYI